MAGGTIGRRQVLRRAGVAVVSGAALAGAGGASASASGGDRARPGLTGTWLVHRRDVGGSSSTTATASFAAGWVFMTADINPAGPPAFGTWSQGEAGRFEASFWQGQGGNGQPNPTVLVHIHGQLEHATIRGTYDVKIFDPSGKQVQTAKGAFTGKRVSA